MEALAISIGLLLRLGLPIAITALVAWWLRRLDARWQREAQTRAARRALATPCWEIRVCPPKRRADCPAFIHPDVPCWQWFRDERGQLRDGCLDCTVFRGALAPVV
jgi:hypothetical protein